MSMLESQSFSVLFALSIIAISSFFRFLNFFVWPSCPILCHRNSSFNKAILARCSILRERQVTAATVTTTVFIRSAFIGF